MVFHRGIQIAWDQYAQREDKLSLKTINDYQRDSMDSRLKGSPTDILEKKKKWIIESRQE